MTPKPKLLITHTKQITPQSHYAIVALVSRMAPVHAPLLHFQPSFLLMAWGKQQKTAQVQGPHAHMGDQEKTHGFRMAQLQLLWPLEEWVEDSNSAFQMNNFLNK